MSSDVFILCAVRAAEPVEALREALNTAGVKPAKVQDLLFGCDGPGTIDLEELIRLTGLTCPATTVSSSLRALGFAAQSIICGETDIALVGGAQDGPAAALLLASPAAVGRSNLMPLARLEAFSVAGVDAALKKTDLAPEDVQIRVEGTCGALLVVELMQALGKHGEERGLLMVNGGGAVLVERV